MKGPVWSNSVPIENAISDFDYICNTFHCFTTEDTAKATLERELDDYRGDELVDFFLELLKGDTKGSPKKKVIGK